MSDVIAELQTKMSELGVEYPISLTAYNIETGEEVFHWDYVGGEVISENTD